MIAWLVLAIFGAIMVTACQPTAPSDGTSLVDPNPPISTETLPTQPPPQPTERTIESTESIPEPTEPSPLATHTSPAVSAQITDLTVCEGLPDGTPSPGTPTSQAGISVEIDSMFPPAPPAKVEGIYSESGILLTWGGTGTDVDQFYKVYLMMEGDDCWQLISIKMIEGDNKGGYEFEAIGIVQTENTTFAITTVDIYGNESILSIAEYPGTGP